MKDNIVYVNKDTRTLSKATYDLKPVRRAENLPKRPKSDAFLGILLHSKCVTFWSDSVRQEKLTHVGTAKKVFSLSSSLTPLSQ